MHIKVTAISEVTDLEYMKKLIEALGFITHRFDDELFVKSGINVTHESGFQLAQLFHNNAALVSYKVDQETESKWHNGKLRATGMVIGGRDFTE